MAPRQRTQKAGLDVSPPDNLPLRTQIIEQYVPQLSFADLEAVGQAMQRRWKELKAAEQRRVVEAHYAHLRALPAGASLQVATHHSALRAEGFAPGDSVTMERPLRPPSTKLMVHDRHGKPWRFPMDWLISETEDEAMRTALRSALEAHAREALMRAVDHRIAQSRAETPGAVQHRDGTHTGGHGDMAGRFPRFRCAACGADVPYGLVYRDLDDRVICGRCYEALDPQ